MPRETRFRTPDFRRLAPLLIPAVLAVVLRLPHLDWGLPAIEEEALPAKKALEMWGFADGRLRLDPATAGWPALSFYAHLLLQHLQWIVGRIGGIYADRLDFWLAWQLDPTAVMVWGRAMGVALAAGVAGIGAAIGRRVAGESGAWLTGLLLAASPLLARHARLVGPDIWVAFFAALAVLAMLDLLATGRRRDYLLAALWIGLGAAAKYTPAVLALSLFLIHLERLRIEGRSLRLGGLDDRRLWLAALVCVLAFIVATPYTLLDLDVLQRDVGAQTAHMGSGHFGQGSGNSHLHYLNNVLPGALGWPAYLVCLAGLILGRHRPEVRALIWCILPLYLLMGGLSTRFDRYMLPLLPALAAGAGVLVGVVALRWPRLGGRTAVAVVAAGLMIVPVLESSRLVARQGLTSTQNEATAWLKLRATASGVTTLTEVYGPHLDKNPHLKYRDDPVIAVLDQQRRAMIMDRPYQRHEKVPMYTVNPLAANAYYDIRHCLAYDFVVTSQSVRDRYLAEPERFPAQIRYYDDLERWARLAHVAAPGAAMRGPEIRIYHLDDAARRAVAASRGWPEISELVAAQVGARRSDYRSFLAAVAYHGTLTERWQMAERYGGAVVALADAHGRHHAVLSWAVARFHLGDLEGAGELFTELAGHPDVRVTATGYLGVIAERQGDPGAAARFYRRVMEMDPGGPAGELARRRLAALTPAPGE